MDISNNNSYNEASLHSLEYSSSNTESETSSIRRSLKFYINDSLFKARNYHLGEYMNGWIKYSQDLIIKNRKNKLCMGKEGPLGLFHLFISQSFKNTILEWSNTEMRNKAKPTISKNEFNYYLALEIAMGLCHQNKISDYWSTKSFVIVKGFPQVMSRKRFQEIRANLKSRPEKVDTPSVQHNDLL